MQTLRLFYDVARCHSFSQAAEIHGISQPAASQRISQLEKRLGVTLIDRSVRPLTLTPAGTVFLEGCEEILHRYDRLEQKVTAMIDQPAGQVRVAAIYSAGIDLLNRIRERFEAEHPNIAVRITYGQPDEVHQHVLDSAADVGILSYPDRWRKVRVIPLRDEVMSVVCSPSHELASREYVTAADLSPHAMVTFDEDLPVGQEIRRYLREHDATPTISNSFDNIDTIKSAVAVTDRFAILPARTVLREVSAGSLAAVRLEPKMVRPIGIIHRRSRNGEPLFLPAVQDFVNYLLEHAGPSVDIVGQSSHIAPQPAGAQS